MNDAARKEAPGADGVRPQVLAEAVAALGRLAPGLPPMAAGLLARLLAAVPTAELAATPPEALAEAAASLFGFAQERRPRQTKVRLLPPGPGRALAVAEIVTDDMPFLVDSVLAALAVQGRVVRQLLHPVLRVARDARGALLALDGGTAESMMRIALAPGATLPLAGGGGVAGDWTGVEAALARAMSDVRLAVDDFPAMLARLGDAAGELPPAEEEAREFLRWMGEDNFVLLGHRRLALSEGGLSVAAEEDLGLLRDATVPVFDALRDLAALPGAVRANLQRLEAVTVAKANMRATVHRPQHADVVMTRITDDSGRVAGVRLFLGLFAAGAYNRNPRSIPLLRAKVLRILAAAGLDPESHDGRALRNILDTWPRDELFQAPEDAILAGCRRALDLQIRPRAALVVRRDPFERFVSVIAWLPRDTFDTQMREKVGSLLADSFAGRRSAFYTLLGDAPLARVHYVIGTTPGAVPAVEEAALEAAVTQVTRGFRDRLEEALLHDAGAEYGAGLLARWRDAFPAAYRQAETAATAIGDLALANELTHGGRPRGILSRPPGAGPRSLMLRLASPGGPLALADALPLFESLDLRAIEEVPYRLDPRGGPVVVLHVYRLEARADVEEDRLHDVTGALHALLRGDAEADGFNRLVLRAGLSWKDCWLLRAMYRWLKQVGFPFAQDSVEAALAAHPDAARILVDLFHQRFATDVVDRDESKFDDAWRTLLDGVANPDEDRILSRLRTVLDSMLRTNFFQAKDYLSFKIDSARAGDMPAPRPWREIFVHSPRMEGCHLRAGPVARGGIRWSDRREDFRTEVLGLMKAQRLKNVVIVPTGAKGGFILKHPPPASDREAFMAEGVACYRTLVRGMLDLTDNYAADGSVVTPDAVVPRDGADPYIVAAADKGTATFSDIANALSADYDFWLGDAFASGGSAGYDHKGMGITARGAWVMIDRHFFESRGAGVQEAEFTCAGVGDMSGDVFGNGLLVSAKTKLVAAFDHRHIFIDPDPDPAVSFAERQRLFALPRSSWADYEVRLLSKGGAILPRNAKTLPLSPEARALLGIEAERAEPAAILRAILTLPVDLLYFGGIGTYVKSSGETQAEAGDRANDSIRVDGRDLRARIVGEGANLGVTQAGRIEASRAGVRINTDALDNSAGVSTSDHEVNIKILLTEAEREGSLTRRQRDELLAGMTEEVGHLVLADNHAQSIALSLEAMTAVEDLSAHAALMARLEAAGFLDRAVSVLPDAAAIRARAAAGEGLTRPELAALLPAAKLWLAEAIEASGLAEEAALAPLLVAYFPTALRERFGALIPRHRLRRELLATALCNQVVNRLGVAALGRLAGVAGSGAAVARAAWLAGALFGLEEAYVAIDGAPAPAATRLAALLALRRLQEGAARDLLAGAAASLEAALAALRPGVAALVAAEVAAPGAEAALLRDAGIPGEAAALAGAAPRLAAAPAVVRLAAETGAAPADAAAAWRAVGDGFALEALRAAAEAARVTGPFAARAKAEVLADLAGVQARLALARLAGRHGGDGAAEAARLAREAAGVGDLVAIGVAARALAAVSH
ncbi:NAD-glutamate dehydrogenase domain-containing protein [Falsiroseomonas stagni]|uniref:Glutamate dehydrogenase n=1 Tax=Falsiroseomonas stagni DSM 19981 TaxID=1123062 RepID=A0A1I3X7N0_9PROT|nr:NAD-glutamate dehydrogenase domain-containing protein [Falsiroseomonas stagni]SFK15782.1 glutamate dehydrogenase [Falsiroseomonas stagni DSM 19981]